MPSRSSHQKQTQTLLSDALAHVAERLSQANLPNRLFFDDHFQGDHAALTSHTPLGHCEWQTQSLSLGARLLLFANTQAAAGSMHEALAGFEQDVSIWRRERRKLRGRMRKMARDLAFALSSPPTPQQAAEKALQRLKALFPTAQLVIGVSRRFNTREKDLSARRVFIQGAKARRLQLRHAALIPVGDLLRAAPYDTTRGAFVIHGFSQQTLSQLAKKAGVSLQDAHATYLATPAEAPSDPSAVERVDTFISDDTAGFCLEVGCDRSLLACDLFSGCDGLDGCDF